MKKHFRFGDIPADGKSYNYLTGTTEKGVSTFELIEGIPYLWNLQLIDSFCSRLNSEPKSFLVIGEEVGRGNDGEPLLKDIKILDESPFGFEEMINFVYYYLDESFEISFGEEDETADWRMFGNIFYFGGIYYAEPKKHFNIKLGANSNRDALQIIKSPPTN